MSRILLACLLGALIYPTLLWGDGLDSLWKQLQSEYPQVRRQAARQLSLRAVPPRYANQVVNYLADERSEVRLYLEQVLVAMGSRAVPALRKGLVSPVESVRLSSVRVLYFLGAKGEPAQADLIVALGDRSQDIVLYVARSLSQHEQLSSSALEPLLQGLNHKSPSLRAACARALGRLNHLGGEGRPHLEVATRDKDSAVRKAAARALERIEKFTTLSQLVASLDSSQWKIRHRAQRNIQKMGPTVTFPLLSHFGDEKGKNFHLFQIIHQWGEKAFPGIERGLASSQVPIRLRACQLVAMWGEKSRPLTEKVISLLGDPSNQVRESGERALVQMGPSIAKSVARQLSHPRRGPGAAFVLSQWGERGAAAVGLVIQASRTDNLAQRRRSLLVLEKMGRQCQPAKKRLVELLGDGDWLVVVRAIRALGNLGPVDGEVKVHLKKLENHRDRRIRTTAAQVLARSDQK